MEVEDNRIEDVTHADKAKSEVENLSSYAGKERRDASTGVAVRET
jgi:hypothetical protein